MVTGFVLWTHGARGCSAYQGTKDRVEVLRVHAANVYACRGMLELQQPIRSSRSFLQSGAKPRRDAPWEQWMLGVALSAGALPSVGSCWVVHAHLNLLKQYAGLRVHGQGIPGRHAKQMPIKLLQAAKP